MTKIKKKNLEGLKSKLPIFIRIKNIFKPFFNNIFTISFLDIKEMDPYPKSYDINCGQLEFGCCREYENEYLVFILISLIKEIQRKEWGKKST